MSNSGAWRNACRCSSADDAWDGLRWLEVNPRSLRINLTPLDVSATLNGLIDNGHQAWVFTIATLAVAEDFSHFASRMGLRDVRGLTFPSPYAVEQNGLVYLPPDLPQPSDFGHTDAVLEAVVPLLDMTAGGMFCLFTSHRALNSAKKWFRSNKKFSGRPQTARPGKRAARRLVATLSRCRGCRAAGHGQLLGRGRRTRAGTDRRCDRQAAVCVSG